MRIFKLFKKKPKEYHEIHGNYLFAYPNKNCKFFKKNPWWNIFGGHFDFCLKHGKGNKGICFFCKNQKECPDFVQDITIYELDNGQDD